MKFKTKTNSKVLGLLTLDCNLKFINNTFKNGELCYIATFERLGRNYYELTWIEAI